MVLVGTAEHVCEKLVNTASGAGLDGIWLSLLNSPFDEDRRTTLERLGGALESELHPQ
jgi:hypothetical protein